MNQGWIGNLTLGSLAFPDLKGAMRARALAISGEDVTMADARRRVAPVRMDIRRRNLRAGVSALLIATALAACGSQGNAKTGDTTSGSSSSGTTASQPTASELLAAAQATLADQKLYHYHIEAVDHNGLQTVDVDVDIASKAAHGRIVGSTVTVEFVTVDDHFYARANRAYWADVAGPAFAARAGDAWVSIPSINSAGRALLGFADGSAAAQLLRPRGVVTLTGPTVVDGKSVFVLKDSGTDQCESAGTIVVSAGGTPYPERITLAGSSAVDKCTGESRPEDHTTLTLSGFDQPVSIAAPATSLSL